MNEPNAQVGWVSSFVHELTKPHGGPHAAHLAYYSAKPHMVASSRHARRTQIDVQYHKNGVNEPNAEVGCVSSFVHELTTPHGGPQADMEDIMAFITQAEKATTEDLIKHLCEIGYDIDSRAINTVINGRINGLTWTTLWSMDKDEEAKMFIRNTMGIDIIKEATYVDLLACETRNSKLET